jgi:hypothetical protein
MARVRRAVRFDFSPGKLTVSSTNPELGDVKNPPLQVLVAG